MLFALAALGMSFGASASLAQGIPFELNGKVLKTKPASAQRIAPLRDAFLAYENEAASLGGKTPANARERLDKLDALALQAKQEIRSLVQQLRAAGEVEAFNSMVEQRARKTGSVELMSEISRAGGGYAFLTKADALIDDMIVTRRRAAGINTADSLFDLFSVRAAYAGIKSTACGAFWFVVSLGYGTDTAYRSCYY